jgi:hypothetical protein
MWARFITVAVAWFLAAGVVRPAAGRVPTEIDREIHDVTVAELKAHIAVLASDAMAGRGLGHAGNQQAEAYITRALRDGKVPPALPDYLQRVRVYEPRLGDKSSLTITDDGRSLADLRDGHDFMPLPESSDQTATGPLIFVGHGISAPALQHDDYANLDARGAVVLAIDGAPDALLRSPRLSSDIGADLGSVDRKADAAREHGAVGLLVIRSYTSDRESMWPSHSSVRSADYRLYDAMHDTPLAVAAISESAARPVRAALDEHRPLSCTLAPDLVVKPITADNILGFIEGRPGATEIVVVGAHLDHDGIDDAGRIYNGADDNASGTAAVIAMAAAFARAASKGTRPARGIVFALWNGEEKGELGAEYYVAHPVPSRRIVANVNLDMIGRDEDIPDPDDPRYHGFAKTRAAQNVNVVHLLGYSYAPDLARAAEVANEPIRLTIKQDYDRDSQHLVRRSDNWPFLQRGIPAVFLTTGLHPDYHTPDDDTERIDFPKLERITELASRLVWLAADGDAPRFNAQ